VCLSVGHVRELCTNGGTDRDADWRVDSGRLDYKLEKAESEEKANGSTNGLGNRRIVVVGRLSGKPRAIIRDRK